MTSYVLISDIHGNIDALRAVVAHIRAGPKPDEILCLGDTIGYCPSVNEVIDELLALEKDFPVRYNLGSHDAAALGHYQFVDLNNDADAATLRAAGIGSEHALIQEYFNTDKRRFVPVRPDARQAMQWTLEHLTPEARHFLEDRLRPRTEVAPGIISVHASPRDPVCEYVRDARLAQHCFESPEMSGVWLCFVGHTHLPLVWRIYRRDLIEMGGAHVCLKEPEDDWSAHVTLDRDAHRYIVNVGSVGQPRDRDPRAAYARFDSGAAFEHIRVEYDIEAAAARIRDAGLSDRLAERLHRGE